MKKAIVIINETHSLFPEQKHILKERFDDVGFVTVPAEGWSLETMRDVANALQSRAAEGATIVFASPIPFLLKELARKTPNVLVFHNDHREKKEFPDGRIVQIVAATGWRLV